MITLSISVLTVVAYGTALSGRPSQEGEGDHGRLTGQTEMIHGRGAKLGRRRGGESSLQAAMKYLDAVRVFFFFFFFLF